MIRLYKQAESYVAPAIEVLDVMVETGFANSTTDSGVFNPSFSEGGDTDLGDEWEE